MTLDKKRCVTGQDGKVWCWRTDVFVYCTYRLTAGKIRSSIIDDRKYNGKGASQLPCCTVNLRISLVVIRGCRQLPSVHMHAQRSNELADELHAVVC